MGRGPRQGWPTLASFLFCVLLGAPVPVSASQLVSQSAPSANWLLSSPARPYLSGPAETAVLWQNGLLRVPPPVTRDESLDLEASGGSAAGSEDVLVNRPGKDETGGEEGTARSSPGCNTQTEVSLARSASSLVAAWVDGGSCEDLFQSWVNGRTRSSLKPEGVMPPSGISLSAYGYSEDAGRTWVDGGELTPPPGGNLFGNPVLSADPAGPVYYATLTGDPFCCDIGVSKSLDGGKSWSPAVTVSGNSNTGALHDKPWIAVDGSLDSPHRGSVYVTWTEFSPDGDHKVLFSRSADGGASFAAPLKLSVPEAGGSSSADRPGLGTQVAVGPNGEIYVVWAGFPAGDRIWFVRSLDGGATFSAPTRVVRSVRIGHENFTCTPQEVPSAEELPGRVADDPLGTAPARYVLTGDVRIMANLPSLAVDTSGSSDPHSPRYNPYRGRVYIGVPHDSDASSGTWPLSLDESDIAFVFSSDRGESWRHVERLRTDSFPSFLIDDGGTQTDQFHPQIEVDDRGRVLASWYDRRPLAGQVAPPNWEMTMFAAISNDGGESFGEPFQVGDEAFPPPRTNPNTNWLGGCYMGLYNGTTAGNGEFLLAWGDNRDHVGALSDMNVYFDRITLG